MKNEHGVVMLPTDKIGVNSLVIHSLRPKELRVVDVLVDSKIKLLPSSHLLGWDIYPLPNPYLVPQHLYFLSDEEIKEGDLFYQDSHILKYKHGNKQTKFANPNQAKKIVATTNKELWSGIRDSQPNADVQGKGWVTGIPKIPQSYIEYYIKEYNAGRLPEKVWLEYIKSNTMVDYNPLKLTSAGEVIVSPVEEKMFARKDVFDILRHIIRDLGISIPVGDAKAWFDKNYPQ